MTVLNRTLGPALLLAIALAALLTLGVPALAQESGLRIVELTVEEERLLVTAEGPADLASFTATIDGTTVGASVAETGDAASTVVFAVETSSSMGNGRDLRAIEAVQAILEGLTPADSAALVTFGSEVAVLVPPTQQHATIVDTLTAQEPGPAASLYTGAHTAFSLAGASDAPASVVLITRGWNFSGSASRTSSEALSVAGSSGAAGFVVALGSDVDVQFLDGIAALGGLPREGDSLLSLAAIAAAIDARRAGSYELVIPLADLPSGAHDLVLSSGPQTAAASFETAATVPPPAVTPELPVPAEASPIAVTPGGPTELPIAAPGASSLPVEPIVLGALAVLAVVLGIVGWRYLKRRRRRHSVTGRLGLPGVMRDSAAREHEVPAAIEAARSAQHPVPTEPDLDDRATGEDVGLAAVAAAADETLVASVPDSTGSVRVTISSGEAGEQEFSVGHEPLLIGRSPQADIALDAPGAPFLHSVIVLDERGRVIAQLLAAAGAGPKRIVLGEQVVMLGGWQFELRDGASAAA